MNPNQTLDCKALRLQIVDLLFTNLPDNITVKEVNEALETMYLTIIGIWKNNNLEIYND